VISVILRLIGRGNGGDDGPTRSGPSAIDLENNRLRLNCMRLYGSLRIVAKFLPAQGYI
jgi:hypothetical protein